MSLRFFESDEYQVFCDQIAPSEPEKVDFKKSFAVTANMDQVKKTKPLKIEIFSKAVDDFFKKIKLPTPPPPVKKLSDILNAPFIIGEFHRDPNPKKFLIENMQTLKKAGFSTFYCEHLYYDDQRLLDKFFETGVMAKELEERLKKIDANLMIGTTEEERAEWKKYTLTDLVKAARKEGIRTVAIDIRSVYENQPSAQSSKNVPAKEDVNRVKFMNYTGYQVIQREEAKKPTKYFSLMGNGHSLTFKEGEPGMADLLGVTSVTFADKKKNKKKSAEIEYNTKVEYGKITLKGDVIIQSEPNDKLPKLDASKLQKKLKAEIKK